MSSIKDIIQNESLSAFNFQSEQLIAGQWVDVKDSIDQWVNERYIYINKNLFQNGSIIWRIIIS